MKYFLAKTEPAEYSISDLSRDKKTVWTGVKNPQALNFLRSMNVGDYVYIYHSGERTIAGLSQVAKTGETPTLVFKSTLPRPITLAEIKAQKEFSGLRLVRQSRLSVMELPIEFVNWIKKQA